MKIEDPTPSSGADDTELLHQPEVVTHRPVLDDLAATDAEDVHELHRV